MLTSLTDKDNSPEQKTPPKAMANVAKDEEFEFDFVEAPASHGSTCKYSLFSIQL
jgi:hypothetical protein